MVTVFVLEDDRDLNAVICRHLEMNGYHTVSCLSVQDAYDAMENTHYDAFISDIMMPGEDGFSFARDSESSLRSVDVFITGIRAKFAACDAFRIESVRGLGYRAVIIANHE